MDYYDPAAFKTGHHERTRAIDLNVRAAKNSKESTSPIFGDSTGNASTRILLTTMTFGPVPASPPPRRRNWHPSRARLRHEISLHLSNI